MKRLKKILGIHTSVIEQHIHATYFNFGNNVASVQEGISHMHDYILAHIILTVFPYKTQSPTNYLLMQFITSSQEEQKQAITVQTTK
jgi:hypothetical protein